MMELINALQKGNVSIKFKSMTSDTVHENVYTLIGAYSATSINHGDKIVAIDTATGLYEDIEKNTIITWSQVDGRV